MGVLLDVRRPVPRFPSGSSARRLAAPGDPRADRPEGHVQHLRDLRVVHALHVAEHDRHPEVLGQRASASSMVRRSATASSSCGRVAGSSQRGVVQARPEVGGRGGAARRGRRWWPRGTSTCGREARPSKRGRPSHDGDQRLLGGVGGVGRVPGRCGSTPRGSCRRVAAAGRRARRGRRPGRRRRARRRRPRPACGLHGQPAGSTVSSPIAPRYGLVEQASDSASCVSHTST